ncbi:Lot5p [Saccharomyces cerevisiae YJM1573]|nr:Lot5p [Saccharomyces cerevisiae YJM1304]AJS50036.1 Lot5p [Saccharomyces cerevisiae YJM1402]AJS55993.1 Lot5p [Saccharomyces cerevisiae YJM1573]CAI4570537.1 AMM_1a_G0031600.mRNA.1.CDS.1 [Saccharomyces cerevisiae]CAI4583890.1 BDM_1a_G0032240.mRNA.1.CDS.1 [Saccharomyces cerevisiae]
MMKKRPKCQIARTKPSVENVIPYNQFKKTQPRFNGNFSALNNEEYIILFGGGRDLILGSLTPCSSSHLSNQANPQDTSEYGTDLFILNSCIIIWFNGLGYGLEIPYSSVLYHASRRLPDGREGLQLEILLTLERDEVLDMLYQSLAPQACEFDGEEAHAFTVRSVELTIRPKYSIYDRHYNNEIETLFTFENFGVNRGDDLVNNCNEALAVCMDLHGEDVQDQDQEQYQDPSMAFEGAQDLNATYSGLGDTLHGPPVYQNDGLADDLDGDLVMDNVVSRGGPEASMSMEFYANQNLAGRKNSRDDE